MDVESGGAVSAIGERMIRGGGGRTKGVQVEYVVDRVKQDASVSGKESHCRITFGCLGLLQLIGAI